jgi:hypothetical protein
MSYTCMHEAFVWLSHTVCWGRGVWMFGVRMRTGRSSRPQSRHSLPLRMFVFPPRRKADTPKAMQRQTSISQPVFYICGCRALWMSGVSVQTGKSCRLHSRHTLQLKRFCVCTWVQGLRMFGLRVRIGSSCGPQSRHTLPLKVFVFMWVQGFVDVWGEGADWEELRASIEAYPAAKKARWNSPQLSWKMVVEGWGLTIQTSQQVDIIERMAYLGFQVNCKDPQ